MTVPAWVTMDDGAVLAAYDFGGAGPAVLLAHATGFHAHTWLPLVALLSDRYHLYAFDERGHGASPTPPNRDFRWARFGDDARAVAAFFGLTRPLTAGHSAGGALLLSAEEQHPSSWSAIWAYEPVVFPAAEGPGANPLADGARRRKRGFVSRQAAYENYVSKPPFSAFTPGALAVYLEHGLVDDVDDVDGQRGPSGAVRLACEPEDEARTYEEATAAGIWERLHDVHIPVHGVAGAISNHPPAQLLAGVVGQLPDATMELMDGLSHFGPFEDPDRVAASIASFFSGLSSP